MNIYYSRIHRYIFPTELLQITDFTRAVKVEECILGYRRRSTIERFNRTFLKHYSQMLNQIHEQHISRIYEKLKFT